MADRPDSLESALPRIAFHAATRADRVTVDPQSVKSYRLIGGGDEGGAHAASVSGGLGAPDAGVGGAGAKTWLFPPHEIGGLLRWQEVRRVGAGLKNLGNTCFLNAVLQCLSYTPPLANLCLRRHHSQRCHAPGFCAYCELEKHVVVALARSGGALVPQAIMRNLRAISRQFRVGRQEDAHELLRTLLDAMQAASLAAALGTGGGGAATKGVPAALAETSDLHQIFGGRLRSRVQCGRCGVPSDTHDPFLDLSLELTRAASVGAALRKFTAVEVLDGKNAYRCSACNQLCAARKSLCIAALPPVLTLQLKRFGSRGGKISGHIAFDAALDLRPFSCAGAVATPSALPYELYAVLVHVGHSVHSGHYYAFVRAPNGLWHCLDDDRVRQVSLGSVLKAHAYLLFYIRAKPLEYRADAPPLANGDASMHASNGGARAQAAARTPNGHGPSTALHAADFEESSDDESGVRGGKLGAARASARRARVVRQGP